MMEPEVSYQYDYLPHGSFIRLMELLPGSTSEQLACRLLVVDLDDPPAFESISYVCGSEQTPEILSCDNKQLRITRNLAIALRRFRNASTTRVLWIDGVCIHQTDTSEKNQQIKLMGRIYRSAKQVLIWLSEDNSEGHMQEAANAIECLKPLIFRISKFEAIRESDALRTEVILRSVENIMADFGLTIFNWTEFYSLLRLWQNPWFSRAWTFQESFLAKKRTLYFGIHELDYEHFGLIYDAVYLLECLTGDARLEMMGPSMGSILFAREVSGPRSSEGGYTLLDMLQSRRGSECKYASDLIYSLLGAATDHLPIEPDYNKPFQHVFAETTLEMIRSRQDLNIIGRSYPIFGPSQLPSWVPDWRCGERGSRVYQDIQQSFFTCTGATKPRCSLSQNRRQLRIAGYLIDTIEATESRLDGDIESFVCRYTSYTEDGVYRDDESLSEALVRIRCTDLTFPDWFENQYMRWTKETRAKYRQILQTSDQVYYRLVSTYTDGIQLVVTTGKRIGMIPESGQIGDIVALFLGGRVPILLRPDGTNYKYVGECYIDQIMDGQALSWPDLPPPRTLTLI